MPVKKLPEVKLSTKAGAEKVSNHLMKIRAHRWLTAREGPKASSPVKMYLNGEPLV